MSAAWYALRRPIPPWDVDRTIPELVGFCAKSHVDEVILMVDCEEFSHVIPTVEWLDAYLPILRRIKKELTKIGVVFSINPEAIVGHADWGRDLRAIHPDVDFMVGHDGAQCRACACPLSPGWRRVAKALWQRYVSLEPAVMWVDDDIRLFNHAPVEWSCFCRLHMDEFSKRVGKPISREELVPLLLAPGGPHECRKIWLDMNRDIMIDTARFLERCVHDVSPNTSLGLMSSGPNSHAAEGRDWKAFTAALAGDRTLYARPCMGNYYEESPRGLYDAELFIRSTMHCLGPGVTTQTEVENWPYGGAYSTSAAFTFLEMALSFALGADGVTLNVFDGTATPFDLAPEVGNLLRDKKAFLDGLAERCQGGRSTGLQLLHAERGSYEVRLPEHATYHGLRPEGQAWRHALEPLGFSLTFEDGDVVALTGQAIRGFPKDKIEKMLSHGVLLDLTAVKCLIEMGFGSLIGVSIEREFHKLDEAIGAEENFNEEFGGAERKYLTLTWPHENMAVAEIVPAPGAVVVSRIVDPDAKPVYPCLTVFENALGGRVAVYPTDMEPTTAPHFLSPYRKQQMEAVVRWLSRDRTPLIVSGGVYPLPFRTDREGSTVVGMFNLSLDDWPSATFDLFSGGRKPSRVELLHEDGAWREESVVCRSEGGRVVIECPKVVPAMSVMALTVWWS